MIEAASGLGGVPGSEAAADRAADEAARKRSLVRVALLDAARGLALAAMIVFHFVWDLDYFGFAPAGTAQTPIFKFLGHAIAAAFLVIVGASLWLAARKGLAPRPFFRRIAMIVGSALAITIATRIVFPQDYIFFGILHCIAVASLAAVPFLWAPQTVAIVAGAISLTLPAFVSLPAFNAPALQWLGLGTYEPVTNDWAPFFPAFGFVLLGLAAVRAADLHGLVAKLSTWTPRGASGRLLVQGGRRSLIVYLAHQPLLFGALFVIAPLVGRVPANESAPFMQECKSQCVAHGASETFCESVCGCVADREEPTALWPKIMANSLSASERNRFNGVAEACIRDLGPAAPPR